MSVQPCQLARFRIQCKCTDSPTLLVSKALNLIDRIEKIPSWVQIESIVVACDGTEYVSSNTLAANTTRNFYALFRKATPGRNRGAAT